VSTPGWAEALKERIKYSRLSRIAALPLRLRVGLQPLWRQAALTLQWLATSREWANFNCEYTPEGLEAVVCALAELSGRPREVLRAYAREIHEDVEFAQRYEQRVRETNLRHSCDLPLRYGRFVVYYTLVRASGARVVFEAGTDRGLGSWAICRALRRNAVEQAMGRSPLLITVDVRADRGGFLQGDEGGLVRRLVGDSVQALMATLEPIDFFLHDTVNEPAHTRAQLAALATRLAPGGWVHSCWFSAEFIAFCDQHDLRALEYVEQVRKHWYAGGRCGLARRGFTR
jgi:predicted O-methyltransferase YrrM